MTQSVSCVVRDVAGLGRRLGAAASRCILLGPMLVGCASQPTEARNPPGAVTTAVGQAPATAAEGGAPATAGTTSNDATAANTNGAASSGATSMKGAADAGAVSSFEWPSALLDARPASHLAAGKRRVAAIVTDADAERRLLVVEVAEGDRNASHVKVRADVPVPASLQTAPVASFSLFMGRDDWPRVIVAPPPSPGAITYHRYRPNEGWKSPADEQGALAAQGRAMGYYGILGHVDPELLCVPDKACYEKRTSGWTKRDVPGPGVWQVTLTSEVPDPYDIKGWAWLPTAADSVLQLNSSWDAPWPKLNEPLVGLATWGRAYFVALTPSGLYRYAPPASSNSGTNASGTAVAPATNGTAQGELAANSAATGWSFMAKVERGSVLFSWPLLRGMLVGSGDALFRLTSPEAQLTRARLQVNEKPFAPGRVTAIGATIEQWPRYFVACDAGLIQLGDIDPEPSGAL